jgi:hypothetical protein
MPDTSSIVGRVCTPLASWKTNLYVLPPCSHTGEAGTPSEFRMIGFACGVPPVSSV